MGVGLVASIYNPYLYNLMEDLLFLYSQLTADGKIMETGVFVPSAVGTASRNAPER